MPSSDPTLEAKTPQLRYASPGVARSLDLRHFHHPAEQVDDGTCLS
jgi:hypothetical protein